MPRRPKVPPPTDYPHIRLYAYVTTSDAWHSLTPLARALLYHHPDCGPDKALTAA